MAFEGTMRHSLTISADREQRLGRLPMVAFLIVGLLLSLLHCVPCGPDFGSKPTPMLAAADVGRGSSRDVPDQQLPCHSGHCLSHVVEQAAMIPADPAEIAFKKLTPAVVPKPLSFVALVLSMLGLGLRKHKRRPPSGSRRRENEQIPHALAGCCS